MMISEKPLVSIAVPFYNSENYIIHTLNSIKAQTYKNIELILINDCSPDNSKQAVEGWLHDNRTRFSNVVELNNARNMGLAFSCKKMQEASTGIFFSKLDSDDIILPNKIEIQVEFLVANPKVALVYSNASLINEKGDLLSEDYFAQQQFTTVIDGIGPSGYVFNKLLIEDFIPNPSVLVRKGMMDAVGGYDDSLFNEDWDMWLRIAKKFPIGFIEGCFSQYRIHSESMMRKSSSLVRVYASCIKALLKHQNLSKEFNRIIAKHLYTYAIGMYRYGVINKEFLRKNFLFNKNIKSLIYYLLGTLGIKINQAA